MAAWRELPVAAALSVLSALTGCGDPGVLNPRPEDPGGDVPPSDPWQPAPAGDKSDISLVGDAVEPGAGSEQDDPAIPPGGASGLDDPSCGCPSTSETSNGALPGEDPVVLAPDGSNTGGTGGSTGTTATAPPENEDGFSAATGGSGGGAGTSTSGGTDSGGSLAGFSSDEAPATGGNVSATGGAGASSGSDDVESGGTLQTGGASVDGPGGWSDAGEEGASGGRGGGASPSDGGTDAYSGGTGAFGGGIEAPSEALCKAEDAAIDGFADCDATLTSAGAGWGGTWRVEDGSEAPIAEAGDGSCTLNLAVSSSDPSRPAQVTLLFEEPTGAPCPTGLDASAFDGLVVFARGRGSARIELELAGAATRFETEFQLTESGSAHGVAWDGFRAVAPDPQLPPSCDPAHLGSIRLQAVGPDSELWVTQVTFGVYDSDATGLTNSIKAGG